MNSLGKYTLIKPLGMGSMGTVYLARDTVLDREVALKTIHTDAALEPEVKERFYREARTCARLHHPNILTIFELGEQDNFAFIAMELLSGSYFGKVIETHSSVELVVRVEAMIQVCEALSYAHQQGIIHGDVKPGNLFLTRDNRAKVLDFGIARLPSSRLTLVGRVLGAPNYMAPEQILGKTIDGRSDLFSVAIVLFELLVGRHPFGSALIPRRIVDGEPDSIFDYDSNIPLPFERVFERGLAKDPDRRYATGNEFASDLRAIADGLRQNSSPGFSKFELPPLRPPVSAQPVQTPILNEANAADTGDLRLSEFLRLLRSFDSAVDRRDYSGAEGYLLQLVSLGGEDAGFAESLRLCREKVLQIAPEPATQSAGAASRESLAHWLRAAVSAIQAQSDLSPPAIAPPPAMSGGVTQTGSSGSAHLAGSDIAATVRRRWAMLPRSGKALIALAAAGIIGVALAMFYIGGNDHVDPYVAMAVVTTPGAMLYRSVNPESAIRPLQSGTRVALLQLPESARREWLLVEPVIDNKKRYGRGYVNRDALGHWSSTRADVAFALAHRLGPAEVGSEPDIRQIEAFQNVINQYPKSKEARSAAIEEANLLLELSGRINAEGGPEENWRRFAEHARNLVATLPQDPRVAAVVAYADEILDPPRADDSLRLDGKEAHRRSDSSDEENQRELARAKQLNAIYDYAGAIQALNRYLAKHPDDKKVQAERKNIQDAKDLEDGLQ